MTLNGVMAVTLRNFTEFGKPACRKRSVEEFMHVSIVFLVRVQCHRKESSRSLSHLLVSFLCKPVFLSQNTIDSIVHAASLRTCVITCHITLCRPIASSSSLKVNNRSFRHTSSPCLWNQLPKELHVTADHEDLSLSSDLTHVRSVHHFLHHHCHHPLYSFSLPL